MGRIYDLLMNHVTSGIKGENNFTTDELEKYYIHTKKEEAYNS